MTSLYNLGLKKNVFIILNLTVCFLLFSVDDARAQLSLIKDINPTALQQGSNPNSFVSMGGDAYFFASDALHGNELRKLHGGVVTLVKDINPGPSSSIIITPEKIVTVNGLLFFAADDGIHGPELWRSDGTTSGTVLIKDIVPTNVYSNPEGLTVLNNEVFFSTDDGIHGSELWKSDGTASGTVIIDIVSGPVGSSPLNLTVVNNTLFFETVMGTGAELWKSNGLAAGTVLVKSGFVFINEIVGLNNFVYFTATDIATSDFEIWKSDGSTLGTSQLTNINTSGGSSTGFLTPYGNYLYFSADDGSGPELWRTNGFTTNQVANISASGGSYPQSLISTSTGLYFFASADGVTFTTWKTTGVGVSNVSNLSSYSPFATNGTDVFLTADDLSGKGSELWKIDGVTGTSSLVKDIQPGPGSSYPYYLSFLNGTLYFSANDGSNGGELWKSDGTPGGTTMVQDIDLGIGSSSPQNIITDGTYIYFAAFNPATGTELYKSDGAGTTSIAADINVGSGSSDPRGLAYMSGAIYFFATDGSATGRELWKYDIATSLASLVKDINSSGSSASYPDAITVSGSYIYFAADDGTNGTELWKSQGTTGTTSIVKDIYTGSTGPYHNSSSPQFITDVGGTIFFAAYTSTGYQLWKSDGTSLNTVLVKAINPVGYFTNVGGTLFFAGNDGTNGTELWKSDGSLSGTVPIEIVAGPGSSSPMYITNFGGAAYFSADDGINGRELWKSNGTTATMVSDINIGPDSSTPSFLVTNSGKLYFQASDSKGPGIWMSSGATACKVFSESSSFFIDGPMTTLSSSLYFSGISDTYGAELYAYNTALDAACKASQTITFSPLADATYGSAPIVLTGTASSALTVTYSSSNSAVATVSGSTVIIVGAGITTITASQPGDASYNYALDVLQTLKVNKATLTATANNSNRVYGASNPTLTVSYSGFVNSETSSVLDTPPATSTPALVTSNVGTYNIVPSGGADNNYTYSYINGTLTINKATLTATADNASRIYGTANPTFAISYSGFANSETASVLDTPPSTSTPAVVTSNVGSYNIVPSGGTDNNYAYSYANGILTINKATLTATANDANRVYGAVNPLFTVSYSGFVNSETSSVLDTQPTASTSAVATSNVGTYGIVPSGGSDNNYTYSFANGTLTINKATLTATANDASRVYGAANPTFTVSYSGFVNSETASVLDTAPTVSTSADATSNTGTYSIVPSGGSDNNYTYGFVNGTLTITKADQSIAFDALRLYGVSEGSLTLTATSTSGLAVSYTSSNSAVATISGNIVTLTGVGTTVIIASQPGDINYNSAVSVTQNLVVNSKNAQTITFTALSDKAYGDAAFTLTASVSSSLPFTYTSGNTSVATISGSTLTIVGVGSAVITASQAGDANYNPAIDVNQTLTVSKGNQTINFPEFNAVTEDAAPITLPAITSSGLTITYTSDNSAVATVSTNILTVKGRGTATITAEQPGDDHYNSATTVSRQFIVGTVTAIEPSPLISIKLYPNPINEAITIEGISLNGSIINISVCNLLGIPVLQTERQVKDSRAEVSVDLTSLPPGIYLMTVKSGTSQTTKRIIKN